MEKRIKAAKIFFVLLLLLVSPVWSFEFFGSFFEKNKKETMSAPKMPQTKQEWLEEAKSIPLKDRVIEPIKEPESDKKNYYPKTNYVFEKYNYPQGKREFNIENIKKYLISNPIIIADINCRFIAYSKYYYSPYNNQISSRFFVEKLDTTKNKTRRILAYNHDQKTRKPVLEAGVKEQYPNLFNGLTLVDWSNDSKKVLIKEKVGSTQGGIYKTNLYVYFLESDYVIKLNKLDNTIKNYFLDDSNIDFDNYRYFIEPLGFSADNDDVIVVLCYCYNKEGKKVFFGAWGFNCMTREVFLYSRTNPSIPISLNGLILKRVLE